MIFLTVKTSRGTIRADRKDKAADARIGQRAEAAVAVPPATLKRFVSG